MQVLLAVLLYVLTKLIFIALCFYIQKSKKCTKSNFYTYFLRGFCLKLAIFFQLKPLCAILVLGP